jgi:hypothetical protein
MGKYGKLREKDAPILKSVVELFRKHNLKSGLHGTSLWNPNYKDVDLLVISDKNAIVDFYAALEEMKVRRDVKIISQRGNEKIGLDYDVEIGRLILHLSYVILL